MKRYFFSILIMVVVIESFARTYTPGVAIRVITNPLSTQSEIEQAIKDVSPQWRENNGHLIKKALQRLRVQQSPNKSHLKKTYVMPPQRGFIEYYDNPLEIQGRPPVQIIQKPVLEDTAPLKAVVASPELYNTQFLKKKKNVREFLLTKEGFSEAVIKKTPKIFSSILYKTIPRAQYALVCFGGWGQAKEFLAPLYEMVKDQPCNIFLCETRTIGQSIVQNAWEFGMYSEQDVIDCIAKAHELSQGIPLIVWGTCAGAFYAARALVMLNEEKKLSYYNVAGLVFDSGWGSVDEAIVTQWKGRIKEKFARLVAPYAGYKDYRQAEQTLAVKMLSDISNWFIDIFSWYTVKPLYMYRTYKTDLSKTIGQLTIPIFFIHSLDDWTKPISMSKQLYEKARNKTAWWIEFPSTHSMHHFKHKEEYKKRCIDFIEHKVLTLKDKEQVSF